MTDFIIEPIAMMNIKILLLKASERRLYQAQKLEENPGYILFLENGEFKNL